MAPNKIVSREEWLKARLDLLEREKAFTRQRAALSQARRALPRVLIDKRYVFENVDGERDLAGLFGAKSQLIVYHFMFGEDWAEGCASCSFWADSFERNIVHLAARDVAFAAISTAAPQVLDAYKRRMGWSFAWYSARKSSFNQAFGVSFSPEQLAGEAPNYNFGTQRFGVSEAPGISVFCKDQQGRVLHCYSTFARGLDEYNAAYHYLDIAPNGRDEDELPVAQAWVRRRDRYEDAPDA